MGDWIVKKAWWILGWVMVWAGAALAQEGHFEPRINTRFPLQLAEFEFRGVREYDEPGLGVSLAYQHPDGVTATLYIYNLGLAAIPDGAASPAVRQAFENSHQELLSMAQMGQYENIEVLGKDKIIPVREKPPLTARLAGYEYNVAAMPEVGRVQSSLVLWGYRNQFIKARISYAKDNAAAGQERTVQFIAALGDLMK
jgi:hypothetical protein